MNPSQPSQSMSARMDLRGLFFLAATISESEHHYRVRDPSYSDYHLWNNDEVGYDHRSAVETHRDPNRDFRKIPPARADRVLDLSPQ